MRIKLQQPKQFHEWDQAIGETLRIVGDDVDVTGDLFTVYEGWWLWLTTPDGNVMVSAAAVEAAEVILIRGDQAQGEVRRWW